MALNNTAENKPAAGSVTYSPHISRRLLSFGISLAFFNRSTALQDGGVISALK